MFTCIPKEPIRIDYCFLYLFHWQLLSALLFWRNLLHWLTGGRTRRGGCDVDSNNDRGGKAIRWRVSYIRAYMYTLIMHTYLTAIWNILIFRSKHACLALQSNPILSRSIDSRSQIGQWEGSAITKLSGQIYAGYPPTYTMLTPGRFNKRIPWTETLFITRGNGMNSLQETPHQFSV